MTSTLPAETWSGLRPPAPRASALALTATPTLAYQGNMERALSALGAAMQSLQAATPNKGGHRERAMRLIEHAMGEVQAGIDFAYPHGGGGY